jgi:ribonuclease HI
MSTRHDLAKVLRHLADSLNIEGTLAAFPGMTREALADMLRSVTDTGKKIPSTAVLSVDGAARGNPGQAGAGMVLETVDGSTHRFGEYLGEATNNVAEYKALLLGVQKASQLGVLELQVRSDSELIVKQLNGLYRVKNPQLQELYFSTIKAISSFEKITFTHIPREENKEADRMANLAIDAKGKIEI